MQTLHFLVADDAGFIRDLVKRALKSQFTQCQIDEAVNGHKARTLLSRKQYDLVLCDWEMPELSGLELLEWLRGKESEEGLDRTPFIMVTSRGDKSHVVKAVEAGVNDYIGKPFSNDQLLKKIFKALSVNHRDLIRAILKGRSTMAKNQQSYGESASMLMGGQGQEQQKGDADEAASSAADLLTAGSPSSKLVAGHQAGQGRRKLALKVALRSSKASWTGSVRDLNLTDIAVQIEFEQAPPPVLQEQVVVDIQVPDQDDSLARINGFVTRLELQEASLECRHARLNIKFVDDDEDKMAVLSRLVSAFRGD